MSRSRALDTGSKYFVILGATTKRGAKFGVADTDRQVKAIVQSWKLDGLSGEYAVFRNECIGNI